MDFYTTWFLGVLVCCATAAAAEVGTNSASPHSGGGGTVPPNQLHLQMTVEQLKQTFSRTSHRHVPRYQLVHVGAITDTSPRLDQHGGGVGGRHVRSVHMRAFDRAFHLNLVANQHIDTRVPLFNMQGDKQVAGSVSIERVPDDTALDVGSLYQDLDNQAALTVGHDKDGSLTLYGKVGDLVLAPVPENLRFRFNSSAVSVDEAEVTDFLHSSKSVRRKRSSASISHGLHFVYKNSAEAGASSFSDFALADEHQDGSLSNVRNKRDAHEQVEILYPEILFVLDYETCLMHNFNTADIKRYMLSFLNAVSMRYRSLKSPQIHLHLSGIVISKDRAATPYLEASMLKNHLLDANRALKEISRYLFREHSLPSYDIALVLTKRDMCTRPTQWSRCDRVTAGYAYVGGSCGVSQYYGQVNSVGLVEDSGGFTGIIVTAHELGHLLGAVHDGSPAARYLGGPGASTCPWTDGYIMSDLRYDHKGLQWSRCSEAQFKYFANSQRSHCMHNKPSSAHDSSSQNVPLPGVLQSLDEQCRIERGSYACFHDKRACTELFCYDEATSMCISHRPAAEGSSCGRGMRCQHGWCRAERFFYHNTSQGVIV